MTLRGDESQGPLQDSLGSKSLCASSMRGPVQMEILSASAQAAEVFHTFLYQIKESETLELIFRISSRKDCELKKSGSRRFTVTFISDTRFKLFFKPEYPGRQECTLLIDNVHYQIQVDVAAVYGSSTQTFSLKSGSMQLKQGKALDESAEAQKPSKPEPAQGKQPGIAAEIPVQRITLQPSFTQEEYERDVLQMSKEREEKRAAAAKQALESSSTLQKQKVTDLKARFQQKMMAKKPVAQDAEDDFLDAQSVTKVDLDKAATLQLQLQPQTQPPQQGLAIQKIQPKKAVPKASANVLDDIDDFPDDEPKAVKPAAKPIAVAQKPAPAKIDDEDDFAPQAPASKKPASSAPYATKPMQDPRFNSLKRQFIDEMRGKAPDYLEDQMVFDAATTTQPVALHVQQLHAGKAAPKPSFDELDALDTVEDEAKSSQKSSGAVSKTLDAYEDKWEQRLDAWTAEAAEYNAKFGSSMASQKKISEIRLSLVVLKQL